MNIDIFTCVDIDTLITEDARLAALEDAYYRHNLDVPEAITNKLAAIADRVKQLQKVSLLRQIESAVRTAEAFATRAQKRQAALDEQKRLEEKLAKLDE